MKDTEIKQALVKLARQHEKEFGSRVAFYEFIDWLEKSDQKEEDLSEWHLKSCPVLPQRGFIGSTCTCQDKRKEVIDRIKSNQ